MPLQVAHPKGHTDSVFGERLARGSKYARAQLEAARGKRNVGSDRDVTLADMLGDPVVRGIGSVADDDMAQERIAARPKTAIADDVDDKVMSAGHPFDFRLHRTSIAVDIYLKHGSSQSLGFMYCGFG